MQSPANSTANLTETLGRLSPGDRAVISDLRLDAGGELEGFMHRLLEIGFLVGEEVEVLHQAPYSGDPISVRIKEATYVLRRSEADRVHVRLVVKSPKDKSGERS